MGLNDALSFVQIILAIVLIVIILLQTKGAGFTGMFGGDSTSVYRTKRGFELLLFRFTIGLSVGFFLIALINSLVSS